MFTAVTGFGAASMALVISQPVGVSAAPLLPTLPPLQSLLPTLPILPTPTPPSLSPTATPCLLNCTTPTPGPSGSGRSQTGGQPTAASATGTAAASASAAPAGTAGRITNGAPPSGGLNIGPPPSVLAIGPGTAISFGKAPFLWPLFAALDVFGLAAVVTVVRKTWSRSAQD